eukprot:1154646-Prymnesium_polylepis.1
MRRRPSHILMLVDRVDKKPCEATASPTRLSPLETHPAPRGLAAASQRPSEFHVEGGRGKIVAFRLDLRNQKFSVRSGG